MAAKGYQLHFSGLRLCRRQGETAPLASGSAEDVAALWA